MADRSYTTFKVKRGIEKTVLFGETQVTSGGGDTITLGELKATASPFEVYLIKKSDGSEMACSHAAGTNVVTINGAGTNVDCFFMAYGYRAA